VTTYKTPGTALTTFVLEGPARRFDRIRSIGITEAVEVWYFHLAIPAGRRRGFTKRATDMLLARSTSPVTRSSSSPQTEGALMDSSFEYHTGGCHTGAKRTAATGGSRISGIVQESPPSSEIHKPPLVEPKASRRPLSSTARP
jgi:hypothetical protein